MKCPQCQVENSEGSKFCGGCGARFYLSCSECGTNNPAENKFCNACGSDLKPVRVVSDQIKETMSPPVSNSKETIRTDTPSITGERKHVTVLFSDLMPIPFPESVSGLDIRLLQHFFAPEEAEIALELSALPEPLERIHKRLKKTGISLEALEKILDKLTEKGSILGGKFFERKGPKKYYSKAQLAIGMYELQAGRLTKDLEKEFQDYMDEKFYKAFHSKKTSQMRTIPINKGVNIERFVDSYDNARDIVQKTKRPVAVIECVCRSGQDLLEKPCKHSDIRETCLLFEDIASFAISIGGAREISKEEMLETLNKAEDAGFVLQPENNQNPNFICCCCGCCCNVLRSVMKYPRPVEYYHSNYYSAVDPEK
jgi:hypothetical protein